MIKFSCILCTANFSNLFLYLVTMGYCYSLRRKTLKNSKAVIRMILASVKLSLPLKHFLGQTGSLVLSSNWVLHGVLRYRHLPFPCIENFMVFILVYYSESGLSHVISLLSSVGKLKMFWWNESLSQETSMWSNSLICIWAKIWVIKCSDNSV